MRVLICGAGIAGLSLALRLHQLGHDAVIVEQSAAPRGGGYMIDFFGPGFEAAEKLGLLPQIEQIHYPIARLSFFDGNGNELFSLPYKALRRRLFDNRHFNFMRDDLELILHSQIKGRVELRFGTTIASIQPDGDGVFVKLSDGSTERWELLVGADGIHSQVRAMVFGEEANFVRFLGFHSAAFVLDQIPESVRSTNSFDALTVPHRQVGVYPIRGGRLATFFAHRAERSVGRLSRELALKKLREVYGDLNWIVGELLDKAADATDLYYDDISQIQMANWSSGRVVLLGDACQSVSLLAGQGASMAMVGACALAEELHAASTTDEALQRYERQVKPIVEQKQAAGRKIAAWYVPDTAFRLTLRNLAMRMSIWPLTSFLVRRSIAGDRASQK